MASPQKENGYTAIANELLEAFSRLNLSAYAWRVLFCIIRNTYGWNKKTAQLTCSNIARSTGIDVRLIPRTLKYLEERNIIVRNGNSFQLQKNYNRWVSSVEMSSVEMSSVEMKSFICRDEKSSSVEMKGTCKKRSKIKDLQSAKDIYKENINIYRSLSIPDTSYASYKRKRDFMRERLLERLKTYFPYTVVPSHVPNERIDFFLYLIEQNKINPTTIQDPIRYMQSNKLVIEPFPALREREIEREKRKKEEIERCRRERETLERIRQENIDNLAEIRELTSSFLKQLEG